MFTVWTVMAANMTWITQTMWNLKWIFFGIWRSLKRCQHHNRDDTVSLVLYYFSAISSGGLKVHWVQNHGQVVSDSQVGMKSEGCKEKKTEMDWISSGSLSGWKCNLLQATQGRRNILPRHFSHRLVSVEMRDGDVLVQVALWVFLKDCKALPCKSSTNLLWGHEGQRSF